MSQPGIEVIDLLEMSRGLAPDSDRAITGQVDGAVALIRLEKGSGMPRKNMTGPKP